MIIVVTGTVGIDKKAYLAEVCDYAAKRGNDILLCNVGDMMYAEAPDIPEGRILDISLKRLHSHRRSVIKDIIAKSKEPSVFITQTANKIFKNPKEALKYFKKEYEYKSPLLFD